MSRREFDLDARDSLVIPAKGESTFFYAGRSEFAAKGLAAFVGRLETHPLLPATLTNLFCSLSSELCVFAANYGRDVSAHEAAVLNTLVTQSLFFKVLSDQAERAEEDVSHTVEALLRIAAFHDGEHGRHNQRVGEYCALLARHLGLGEPLARAIQLQAQLHDVGNIGVPVEILKKEGVPDFQGVGEHPRPHPARRARSSAIIRAWPWPMPSPSATMRTGTAAVIPIGCRGSRSRWRDGSSPWPTATMPCAWSGPTNRPWTIRRPAS